MFELEREIRRWCEDLRARRCSSSDVAEIETHLRETTEQLTGVGLSPEEALMVATHRLGKPSELATELTRANAGAVWFDRLKYASAGLAVCCVVLYTSACASILTYLCFLWIGKMPWGPLVGLDDMYRFALVNSAIQLGSVGVVCAAVYHRWHRLSGVTQRVTRLVEDHPLLVTSSGGIMLFVYNLVSPGTVVYAIGFLSGEDLSTMSWSSSVLRLLWVLA